MNAALPFKQDLIDSLRQEISRGLVPEQYSDAPAPHILPDSTRATFHARMIKAYGSREAYEAFKEQVGISIDHAANFERYGILLQPLQMQFAASARQCDHEDGYREVAIGGARGPGKSFVLFAQVALDDCQRFPGLKVLYLRHTGKSAKEQMNDLVSSVLGNYPDKRANTEKVDFLNGSRIMIGGFKDDRQALSYQGIEYDVLIVEELTQLTEHTYTTLRLSVRSSKIVNGVAWRPRVYSSFNPLGIGHQFVKRRFVDPERKGGSPKRKFFFGTVDNNVFVNPEYREILEELSGVERRAYLDGDWDISAGAYFETWNHSRNVIKPIDDLTWMTDVWASMDYGFNHWNVVQLHTQDSDGNIYTIDELIHRKTQVEHIAADIHAWLKRYNLSPSDLSAFLVGSDAFNQTGVAEHTVESKYRAHGIYLSRAETSPGSRVAGAHYLASRLGDIERGKPPTWFVTTRCPRLIECLPYLERDEHKPEDVRKVNTDEHGRGGDDPYDALRYGLYRPHQSFIL